MFLITGSFSFLCGGSSFRPTPSTNRNNKHFEVIISSILEIEVMAKHLLVLYSCYTMCLRLECPCVLYSNIRVYMPYPQKDVPFILTQVFSFVGNAHFTE